MTDSLSRLACSAVIVAAFFGSARMAAAQNFVREGFDSPETAWREAGGDVSQYQVAAHQRTGRDVHRGAGCEYIQVAAGDGTKLHFALDVGKARIIEELSPSLWIKSDRPGIQLLARVVLPRTLDPRSGKAMVRYIAGTSYSDVDRWQQLRIENVPRLLQQQLRVLWGSLGQGVDAHEAYLDRLILNVYGGRGETRVWIDDLEIGGFVAADHIAAGIADASGDSAAAGPGGLHGAARPRAELSSSILLVDDRPFFPRLIEYQGEPLSFLKELGFNGILLHETPSSALLDEAVRVGLWLVCPPPRPSGLENPDGPQGTLAPFDTRYDPVLAWRLGQGLTGRELEATRRWADEVRRADGETPRPIVCDPESQLEAYSRLPAAILMARRFPLGTSFELADYAKWLYQRPRLTLAGTPFWAVIQTQLAPELLDQVSLLADGRGRTPSAASEQIQLLAQAALVAGARGLAFASRTPLDASDNDAKQRAWTLELINRNAELIESWVAAGSLKAEVEVLDASGANPGVTGAVLQTDHTRLLLPIWMGTGGQYVLDQLAGNNLSFIVPGAPQSHRALEITPGGLRPAVNQSRKLGGLHVQIAEFGLTGMVAITDDVTIGRLTRSSQASGPRTARIARDLAAFKLAEAEQVDADLTRRGQASLDAPQWLREAHLNLDNANRSLNGRDYRAAAVSAARTMRSLRLLERHHWTKAIEAIGSAASSPLAASFVTLPEQWIFLKVLDSAERSPNLLPEGGMENYYRMRDAGWRLYSHESDGVRAHGQLLSKPMPYAGAYSFQFAVEPSDPEKPVDMLETPPLWLVSPPVPVQAGQWLRIHGWAYVPQPITGSLDGLLIFDSLGGEPLAERIGKTNAWTEFTLYRAAPASGKLTITIAMTGLGEASIDNLTVERIIRRPPRRQAAPIAAPFVPRRSASRPPGYGR
ncbi:MAG TPA: hypothetical protein VHC19_07440 [Pirellulales bacterium]|nr:hypothetical protein [Pirellulales bacterium]